MRQNCPLPTLVRNRAKTRARLKIVETSTHIGYQISGTMGALRPFDRAPWNDEGETDASEVNAGSNSMSGRFGDDVIDRDSVSLGLSLRL